ncbi:hypothetical protein ES319_A02G012400v1 [Gossypium barbadense]|uniref:Ubiquitin-like protease family profile domain-containing protein n=1 Tax=Gossypium barbadense TaxID=3634 RepID=A0A5J5WK12_GOSBA|nr:hypothetical protein ES319_A02G012400v1 [Gossypium barbadense]
MDFDLFDTETALRLLLSSAEAIEDGDLKRADELLQKILILADQSTFGFGDQRRVVKYFADALVRRAYGLHPASSYFTFPVDPAPYYHYNSYHINYVIKKVIDDEKNASNGNRRLHLIDFPVPYDNNYFKGSVLRTLTTFSGDPLPVRVSYILPPFLKKYVEFSRKIMEFLTKDAMNLNVKLENELKVVYANSLAEVDEDKLDFKTRREDEMVVVYYKFKLHKLVRDAEAMKREFVRLKEINPTIVIMLDFYSNHSDSNFLTCFKDSFQYSSNTCTCWGEADIGFGRNEYWWECNRDACEGNNLIRRHQTLSEWQRLFSMGGFSRIPLNHTKDDLSNEEECLLLTERHILDNQTSLKIMGKEEECLILGYKGCPMFFLSAWKPKVEDGHFNSISTNHQFRQVILVMCQATRKIEISKSLALRIFNDFKHMKKMFVKVKIQGTEIGSQKEVISNISTSRCLQAVEETEEVQAVEINGVDVEIVSNGDPETGKANKEKLPETTQRKLTSAVWEHFDRLLVGGEQVAKCKHCFKVHTGSSNSGTTHLRNHLKVCQKEQNQERSHMDLAKMMIKLQCPLDMADQEFFKNFVKGLQPIIEFQSKDILSYIHRIYDEEKEILQLYFDKLASKFNLTVSLWENNNGKTAYCCLIAHFIDDSWELKMKTLGLRTLEDIYDTKAVGGIIRSLVSEWNIGSKVCSITVDNSFLDDSMIQQIKENCLSDRSSLSSAHWFISFTLLEDGFREMDDLLFKLKKSIRYVTETRHGKLKFQEAVDRRESDFDILDSALRSREIFCKLEEIDANFKLNPSMEEWKNAAALQSCLRCFDDIKGTQSLTGSLYFTKLCDIYNKFPQLEESNPPFVPSMKRKFDYYWSLCSLAFAVAAVLDPSLNSNLWIFHTFLRDVYHKYAGEANNLTESTSVLGDSNRSSTESTNECLLDSFRKRVSTSNLNEEASELNCYLNEPLVLPEDGAIFDILGWWCGKSQKFPILAKMARDFLAIPVSIFTPCSNIKATINNPAYSILKPESMEALVCNENWLETPKGKPNHGSNIAASIQISNDEPLSNNNQLGQFQSSSSESDDEKTLKEKGSWRKEDVRTYLVSSFTEKEEKRLNKWKMSDLSGKLIGRDEEFKLMGEKLTPLLMVPRSDETRLEYYIDDSVVSTFFRLLKKRSDRFSKTYNDHYSFDPHIANFLITGSRLKQEVFDWFKAKKLRGVHKMFLPVCLSAHWVLFYVDTKKKKISWLDPRPSSRKSNNVEKEIILQWFTTFLLPEFGYNDAKEWPFIVRTDIPEQKNSVDCGVFVMKYADCLTHGEFFPFTQEDMVHFRHRIFLDIYRGRLYSKKYR